MEVIEIVSEQLGVPVNQISTNSRFVDDLGADSLDLVELIMCLEEHFEIEIPDNIASKIKTVGDAVMFIEGLQNKIDNTNPIKNKVRKQRFIATRQKRNIQKIILKNKRR